MTHSSTTAHADLAGTTAVVTGGTDGIGAATVRLLRDRGADVVAIGRSRAKADALLAREAAGPARPGTLEIRLADLGRMAEVAGTVEALGLERIDLLVHSVGVLVVRPEYTAEGLEKDFAVSYLARYLVLEQAHRTGLLTPRTRLVNLSASAPRVPRFARFEFPTADEVAARTGMRAHGQAQLANDLLTALAPARYGITAVGYGPGAVDTAIRREVPAVARAVLRPLYALATRRPEQAAADVVAALTDPGLPQGSATFRNRRGAFPPSPYVTDRRRQDDLLAVSDELVRRALARPHRAAS
jgi:NAD(P)-dependent dehydrogenase (short-subunit alcohol dehydrogenase family)